MLIYFILICGVLLCASAEDDPEEAEGEPEEESEPIVIKIGERKVNRNKNEQ